MTHKILFVCTGNICRSPTAHAVMRAKINARGLADQFEIDSAGTHNYHIGKQADSRTRALANQHGYAIDDLRARELVPEDHEKYDWILAMDQQNFYLIEQRMPDNAHAQAALFLEAANEQDKLKETVVPDPYYGEHDGFAHVLQLVEAGCDAWLDKLTAA